MLTIRYLGHSAFALEADGKQVLVDPFLTGNPAGAVTADEVNPTTILLTHAHNDHVGDTVELSKRTGATVFATHELATYLGQKGANAVGANHGGTVAFDGGTAKFVPAWHTSSYLDGDTFGWGHIRRAGCPGGLRGPLRRPDGVHRWGHVPLRRHGADRGGRTGYRDPSHR